MKNKPNIKYLFEPRSIAIIGASHHKDKIGYKILENIISSGYKGKIYPVNPQGGKILGVTSYKTIEDINDEIDVVSMVIPAQFVFDAVKTCATKKVKFISIISSGFSEIGNIEEEKKIVDYASEHGMRVLGPNIFGLFSAVSSLNATFGPKNIRAGNVAIITQSGALGIAMIGQTAYENIGLSAIVSVGNKADIDESDILEYLINHNDTKVIMMYIEGVKDGERLIKILKVATRKKPVVVVKSGRSKRGAIAAASHTGSLAGSDAIFDAIIKQCHVLRAESIKEALEWCKFFTTTNLPKGENTIIITNGGGIGVLATDACEKYRVKLYDDYDTLKKTFSKVIPDFGSVKNPVDLTGQAGAGEYHSSFDLALKNNNIDALISLYCETAVFDIENFSRTIKENYQKYKAARKPIVFCLVGGEKIEACVESLRRQGIPVFNDPYESVSCLGAMYSYYDYLNDKPGEIVSSDININQIENAIKKARLDKRSFLFPHEGQVILNVVGIPGPKSRIAHNLIEAVQNAEKIGYPVVMKVVSKDILHKSEVGGVVLDLHNKNEVVEAYEAIINNCRRHNPNAAIEGIDICEMITSGTELIIGARRDKSFGPIVVFGLGGIYVEVMKDVSFRALPLDRRQIISMIKEIKSYPLLLGVRGEPKKDIDSVVDTIIKVGTIIQKSNNISDMEINPLVVYEHGVKAVDVRIMLTNI